jgi:hypothetical protein
MTSYDSTKTDVINAGAHWKAKIADEVAEEPHSQRTAA